MRTGFNDTCLVCKKEISEFDDTSGFMKCPGAYGQHDALVSLMPKFSSDEKCFEAIVILTEGGFKMSGFAIQDGIYSPIINAIRDLAIRLMKYEPINGVWYHDSHIICKSCAEKQVFCNSCGHIHEPTCPICKTVLVPLK